MIKNRTKLPFEIAAVFLLFLSFFINIGCHSSRIHVTRTPITHKPLTTLTEEATENFDSDRPLVNPKDRPFQLASWQSDSGELQEVVKEAEDVSSLEGANDSLPQSPPAFVNEPSLNATEPLSVEECVQIALANHPKIIAARYRLQAAKYRLPQAQALEDPMIDNMFFPIPNNAMQTAGGRMQNTIGLSQMVPWPEKLKARTAVACHEVHVAQAEVASIERDIVEAVRLAYYEIWFAQRGTEILVENQQLVADLIRLAQTRYKSGGSQQDVLNAEIQGERLNQQILELASARAAAEAELATYLQQPQSIALRTDESLVFNELPTRLDELVALAEQCNPELRGLGFQIQRDLQKQRLENLQRYSDFQFGAQYGFMTRNQAISPVADGIDNISFSIGATLPIYRNKINAGINEANANRASTARLRQSEQLTIEGRLRRLLADIDANDQQRTLYNERILPRAQQSLEIALSEYTVGKTTFVQLTDNYAQLLMYRLQIAKLDSTLAARLAQLERTVGCPASIAQ